MFVLDVFASLSQEKVCVMVAHGNGMTLWARCEWSVG